MKKNVIPSLWMVAILFFLNSCSTDDSSNQDSLLAINGNEESASRSIIDLVNNYRIENSLDPLEINETAQNLATEHARYMSENEELSIEKNEERESILRETENASAVLEFNSRFYDTVSLFEQWVDSPSTNRILIGNYQKIGVGAIKDESGKLYYTTIIFRVRD